jgi:Uma2 family endonuclease
MAAATTLLTLQEFHEQYANEHGYEYWFGEAVQKGMPTWLHGALQLILGELFYRLGYATGSEIELRIDPNWQPRPDVIASLEVQRPYPTRPVDIVAEILSDDPMTRVYEKCRNYARIGIAQIFVFDPESRTAWEWSRETENLERVETLRLGNGSTIAVGEIWAELGRRTQRAKPGV